jgi:hypothetical protein
LPNFSLRRSLPDSEPARLNRRASGLGYSPVRIILKQHGQVAPHFSKLIRDRFNNCLA